MKVIFGNRDFPYIGKYCDDNVPIIIPNINIGNYCMTTMLGNNAMATMLKNIGMETILKYIAMAIILGNIVTMIILENLQCQYY